MTLSDNELREKLHEHFAENAQKEMFELSMGDKHVVQVASKALVNLLAHGVAMLAYRDMRYAQTLVNVHTRMKDMAKKCEEMPGGKESSTYQTALVCGSIIELAHSAARKIMLEEEK